MVGELFCEARSRMGANVHLLHDVHNRLTPVESARLGEILEPYNLMFLEDASIAENQQSYEVIRQQRNKLDIMVIIMGLGAVLMVLIPNPPWGRLVFVGCAVVILSIGYFLKRSARLEQ